MENGQARSDVKSPAQYEFLEPAFLEAMNDIGRYGHEKYGENSYQNRREHGDKSRNSPRVTKDALAAHALEHYQDYLDSKPHDHFGTLRHDLAAVAFNSMMEFYFAGLEEEKP
jgi:hypothetical protein